MTVVGLDLHEHYITACAIDAQGAVIAEHRRVRPELSTIIECLASLPAPVTVAMEATLYWAWLQEHLVARGYEVQVAHAYQVKLIWQARAKTDPIDAYKLAELTRVQCLPAIWVADGTTRARRVLLRGRAQLVRVRTQLKNRVHGLLLSVNCRWERSDLYGVAGRAWLTTLALPPAVRQQVDVFLELINELNVRLKRLDRAVFGDTGKDADTARAAGCKSVLLDRPYNRANTADYRVLDMEEAAKVILRRADKPSSSS